MSHCRDPFLSRDVIHFARIPEDGKKSKKMTFFVGKINDLLGRDPSSGRGHIKELNMSFLNTLFVCSLVSI